MGNPSVKVFKTTAVRRQHPDGTPTYEAICWILEALEKLGVEFVPGEEPIEKETNDYRRID